MRIKKKSTRDVGQASAQMCGEEKAKITDCKHRTARVRLFVIIRMMPLKFMFKHSQTYSVCGAVVAAAAAAALVANVMLV